jgi:hypothetical protein
MNYSQMEKLEKPEYLTDQLLCFLRNLHQQNIPSDLFPVAVKVQFPGLSSTQIRRILNWFEINC